MTQAQNRTSLINNDTPIKRLDIVILCGIFLLAGWMRLGRGEIVEYFHDDAMLATLALEMADGEYFPITGILSSTGIPNPPTSVYVMAIPFTLSSDPNFAIQFVMLLNVVGVGVLWLIAHRYFGRQVAIIAGLLYAVNPWAVLFSRKIWAQDLHTPFILLGIFLLVYGFWESRDKNRIIHRLTQVLSIPILLFAFQIHFAAWTLTPIILISLWVGRKHISYLTLGISMILSAIILAPYIIGLTQTLEQDPTRVSDAAERSTATDGLAITADPIIFSLYLSSGIGIETWVAPDQQTGLSNTYPPFTQINAIISALLLIGILAIWQQNRRLLLFLLIWAFLAQAALIPAWTPVYNHYFIPAIPAMLLLSGIGLDFILQKIASHVVKWVVWGIFIVILGMQITTWHTIVNYLERQHIAYPGFTTPIGDLNIIREVGKDSDDVVVISQGMSWNLHHEVAVWDTLLWDEVACVRTMVGDGYAVFPDHSFDVIIAPDAPSNPVNNLYQTTNPIHFDTRDGDNGYTLYQWETPPEWQTVEINPVTNARFDNDVQLVGYALEDDAIYLEWQLPAQNKGADYQYTAQLFDAAGNRIGQLDKTFWHGRHWCTNDKLITWGSLPQHADAVTLKIGMYILGTGRQRGQFFNANVLDELGNPIGQSVDITLK